MQLMQSHQQQQATPAMQLAEAGVKTAADRFLGQCQCVVSLLQSVMMVFGADSNRPACIKKLNGVGLT